MSCHGAQEPPNDQARRRRAKFWKILGHLREFGTVNRCLLINVYPPRGVGGCLARIRELRPIFKENHRIKPYGLMTEHKPKSLRLALASGTHDLFETSGSTEIVFHIVL